jgi:hypothetical protein
MSDRAQRLFLRRATCLPTTFLARGLASFAGDLRGATFARFADVLFVALLLAVARNPRLKSAWSFSVWSA